MNDIVFVIDTRESQPYKFKDSLSIRTKLDAGDYSLQGFERHIAIERKSISDLLGSLGSGRGRFLKSLERLQGIPCRFLLVECSFDQLTRKASYGHASKMHPNQVVGSLVKILVDLQIPVLFAGGRRHGERLVREMLERYYKNMRTK